MSSQSSRDFTFGVEFEFGIRFEKRPFRDQSQIRELIRDTLIAETGLKVRTELEIDGMERGADKIPESQLFTTWAIGTDNSVGFFEETRLDKNHDAFYCCLEMQTPVLEFGPGGFTEIHIVLTALQKHFNVLVNDTCGLHVHVGRGKEGIDHLPLQHLMSTIWVFETQITELLHKSRSSYHIHCSPLYMRSNLGLRGFRGNILDIMLGTNSVNDVINVFGGYENSVNIAYNISNLLQPFVSPVKRTIEFRQHQGCMDSEIVLNWVGFLVELVAWAHKIDHQDFKIFLTKYIDQKEGFSVENLFKEIGLRESVHEFWRDRMAELRAAEQEEENEKEV
ncbi:hypothetical protein EYC80_001745 [Monilinia laxa]|uniref:Amidoligase enzyme n=1 Tax=Monilinia laxa TaxID=61186 RepID=A0A5N6K5U8_MONLA|nr:hypothetical protein EYC80_001745 [Monilinia laxa]